MKQLKLILMGLVSLNSPDWPYSGYNKQCDHEWNQPWSFSIHISLLFVSIEKDGNWPAYYYLV